MNAESLPLAITEVERDAPAPSQFLPDTKIQYAWDSTCLGALKTCPRLYQYQYIDGWAPREDSVHLLFGGWFHDALEHYDILKVEGVKHDEALRCVIGDLLASTVGYAPDPETKAGKYKSRENLIALVVDYLDHYRDDAAETVLLDNGKPAVELSFRFELDWGPQATNCEVQPYLLCGHLDRVVTFSGSTFVMDRKTSQSTLGSYFFDKFEPDNQMTLYTLAGRVILETTISGVIIDGCQILLDKPNEFSRGTTYRTPDQLDEWLEDLKFWLSQAENYANFDYWPMNDTACDKYGGCRFREVCSKSPGVRERFLESKFVRKAKEDIWNPLKPR